MHIHILWILFYGENYYLWSNLMKLFIISMRLFNTHNAHGGIFLPPDAYF